MTALDVYKINQTASAYNESVSGLLKDIVDPLFRYSGISHFCYNRFMHGSRYMTLAVDANLTTHCLSKELDQYLLFENIIIPKNSKRVVFWDVQQDNALLEACRSFNYCHGLSIFVRHEKEIEAWSFATDKDNAEINQFYINHQSLLDEFILYFQEKAMDIINPSDQGKLAIYKDNRFLDLSDDLKGLDYKTLYDLIKVKKFTFTVNNKIVSLSKSEFNCLSSLAEGDDMKTIANKFGISSRTVETHLNNTKAKLGIHSKNELLDMFKCSIYSKIHT
jgi:LuxR family quorum-sensing system transcriptional regulator SolR